MADKNGVNKLAWVQERLAEGMTVYVTTPLRATKITQRNWKRFEASGNPILKAGNDNALLMVEGSRYVDASYCGLRADA